MYFSFLDERLDMEDMALILEIGEEVEYILSKKQLIRDRELLN